MAALLRPVLEILAAAQIECALIGAAALAARGVPRSTADIDLLVVDTAVLAEAFWQEKIAGAKIEIRIGAPAAPLAGLVRLNRPPERRIDLVVATAAWQRQIVERAEKVRWAEAELRVVRTVDLVLLKLYAGGLQDAWDVQQLLAGSERAALEREIPLRLNDLPVRCGELWRALLSDRLP